MRAQPSKKYMSPDIEKTINALKIAQKGYVPGVQPRNQLSISITPVHVSQSTENECPSVSSSQTSLLFDTNNSLLNLVKSYDPESIIGTVNLETSSSIDNVCITI
ncbi:hypothetical protein RI129_005138 [Pyrocoelia pectoralis]|uniref:Uncharacterized protein n=1 Tax=Pyrocoelia pectoralis TaxID=417401 RepID=A0AAN7VHS0_9COLE